MDFRQEAIKIITKIEHPAINHSLYDLGIIKSYEINENNINIILALPALNIPILGMLVQSIEQPLATMNAQVNIEQVVMDQEEMQKFLGMEQSAWKGM